MMKNLYSKIPKVDIILEDDRIKKLIGHTSREIVLESIREELEKTRSMIVDNIAKEEIYWQIENIIENVIKDSNNKYDNNFKRVINGTGVVIHTNLGRSLISEETFEHMKSVSIGYSNLEVDLSTGERGSRYDHLIDIIKRTTGAEDALVVNNNAAAVVLTLSSMAKGKEVITSRGELVEIGGSFRIPDVMEQSGAKLIEVGTTNKTHIKDYKDAITEDTGVLLKVHTSNYKILGFTSNVELKKIVELGKDKEIPVIEDLGSGVLVDLSKYGLEYEPRVQDSVKEDVDIITFSGDKLLGGPQAGIIIGKTKYIEKMKKHPLNRAFRIDKFTISALEHTLRLYLNEKEAIKKIPTLRMLTQKKENIEKKAKLLLKKLTIEKTEKLEMSIVDDFSQVGGGSMPLQKIESTSLEIASKYIRILDLERNLRKNKIPIITRLYNNKIYIDLRTVSRDEIQILADGIIAALDKI